MRKAPQTIPYKEGEVTVHVYSIHAAIKLVLIDPVIAKRGTRWTHLDSPLRRSS